MYTSMCGQSHFYYVFSGSIEKRKIVGKEEKNISGEILVIVFAVMMATSSSFAVLLKILRPECKHFMFSGIFMGQGIGHGLYYYCINFMDILSTWTMIFLSSWMLLYSHLYMLIFPKYLTIVR